MEGYPRTRDQKHIETPDLDFLSSSSVIGEKAEVTHKWEVRVRTV